MSKRVVIIGMGDTGILSAIRLARHADVICISTKACMVSGQELDFAWLALQRGLLFHC